MTTDTRVYPEQYRAAVEWERKRMGDRWLERNVGRVADGDVPAFHARQGAGFRRIGIYALLLDDTGAAAERFEMCAAHYVKSVRESRDRGVSVPATAESELLLEAIYAAILSRNWQLMGVAAREVRTSESEADDAPSPTLRCGRHRAGLLAALLTGHDTDGPLSALAAATGDLSPDVRPSYEPYVVVLRGLTAAEPATVSRGLQDLLDRHAAGLSGEPKRPRELICYPATALIQLARDRGLSVDVDSEFVPPGF
ncbi:MAG: Imm49 family immunity protein [Salinigranum sp.]